MLNHHARNSVFTVLDFEFTHEDPKAILQSDKLKRVFVGTKSGMLYQINYFTRELEGIYKVHESSICSLSISPGFCVSGSEDQYLRVWPLDFSEFLLEAKHEGIVIALDISLNGLEVVCGTSTGGLAILDLGNQNYKTILRSHTEEIVSMNIHHYSNSIITLSKDLTIRLWYYINKNILKFLKIKNLGMLINMSKITSSPIPKKICASAFQHIHVEIILLEVLSQVFSEFLILKSNKIANIDI